MTISSDDERRFYDEVYAAVRDQPDGSLRCDAARMRQILADPASGYYERRHLYGAALDYLESLPLERLRILDYGCGSGDWGVLMATEGARVVLLDLSPVAIEAGQRRADVNGVADRVTGVARDASDLGCFEDDAFDLVFASAALHHTLKYPAVVTELLRVLKPGGTLLLVETFGNNRLLNMMRRLRWRLSGQPDEAGEDILFSRQHIAVLRPHFEHVELTPLNLVAMIKRVFRGHFSRPMVRAVVGWAEAIDRKLLHAWPALRQHCGEVLVVASGARPANREEAHG